MSLQSRESKELRRNLAEKRETVGGCGSSDERKERHDSKQAGV